MRHQKTKTKNKLYYPVVIIIFITIIFFGSNFIFTEAQGSSSGSVIATVTINPLTIDLRSSPRSPFIDKTFSLRSTLNNTGGDELTNVEAKIFLPAGLSLIPGQTQTQLLNKLDPSRKKRVNWDILAESAGNHIITVVVKANVSQTIQIINQEASTLVTVRTKPGNAFGAFLSFMSNIFR